MKTSSHLKSVQKRHNFLRNQDLFGHPVRFHFNNRGSDHQTAFGGFISIFAKLAMVGYFVILVKRLLLFEGDQNSLQVLRTDYDELGDIDFTNTSMQIYSLLYENKYYTRVPYDDHVKRHISIEYVAVSQNIFISPIELNRTVEEVVPCTVNNTNGGFEEILQANGYTTDFLCPKNRETMVMRNSISNGESKVVQLQVRKCQPKPDDPDFECASEEEIDEFISNILIYSTVQMEQVDLSVRGRKPVYKTQRFIQGSQLESMILDYMTVDLVYNQIEVHDDLIQLGFPSETFNYFEIGTNIQTRGRMNNVFPDTYYVMVFSISDQFNKHERHTYGLLELLGDLGGVFEVIVGALGLLMLPLSEVNFTFKALEKLYLAKTSDPKLLLKKQFPATSLSESQSTRGSKEQGANTRRPLSWKTLVPAIIQGTTKEQEVRNHYPIFFPRGQKLRQLLRHFFLTSWCFRRNRNPGLVVTADDRYSMLLKKGRQQLQKDLSIEKLIKSLRDMKILMKSRLLDEKTKFEIQHNPRNVIDLDNLNDYLYAQGTEEQVSIEVEQCVEMEERGKEEKPFSSMPLPSVHREAPLPKASQPRRSHQKSEIEPTSSDHNSPVKARRRKSSILKHKHLHPKPLNEKPSERSQQPTSARFLRRFELAED